MDTLTLYYKPTCPYCQKVLRFIEAAGIEVELADIAVAENRERLIEVGGKVQVPCLFINDTALYESDDIIAYLRSTQAN
ncbi:MAG: glutathione S-transferase N-terminal domain-containing protein [Coriobacteriales bacterium]|jgi:glutaredoxin|nr:glutathione S-transferase N-terminal domain-containing protein [Coriobacteriales bacterium]